MTAGRERFAPVKDADIIQSEKSALKNIFSSGVFPINPPSKVQQEFMEDAR
jgi:hypothetical protein